MKNKTVKKTYQWPWKGRYIPIQKLHYNQLFSILRSLNSNHIKDNSSSISKDEWKSAINKEIEFKSKKDTNEMLKIISKRYELGAKKFVNSLTKQFSNAKIF